MLFAYFRRRRERREREILQLLIDNPAGLYGSDFMRLGGMTRSQIYPDLGRLCDRGLVREYLEPPASGLRLQRTRHFITATGRRLFTAR